VVIEATARPGKVLTGNAVTDAAHMDAASHMTATKHTHMTTAKPAHVAATEPAAHVATEAAAHVATAAAAHVATAAAAHVATAAATTTAACKRVSGQSSCESCSRRQNDQRLT
jgi:hypothetical protein